jgi:hypothetical protein
VIGQQLDKALPHRSRRAKHTYGDFFHHYLHIELKNATTLLGRWRRDSTQLQ